MYVDAHAHWTDPRIMSFLQVELEKCLAAGISVFAQGGIDPEQWVLQKQLHEKYPQHFLMSFGLHPYFISQNSEIDCQLALDQLAQNLQTAHAVGEIGLDFRETVGHQAYDSDVIQARQIAFFVEQLELAGVARKPVVMHIVRAHEKAHQILDYYGAGLTGYVHAFNGSIETAQRYINQGFLISVGGAVTFEKHKKLRDAVAKIPLSMLLLETDAPDQAPEGWLGANSSLSLIQIAQTVADIKNAGVDDILAATSNNFKKLYSL